MNYRPFIVPFLALIFMATLWSCSVSHIIPNNQYLLERVEVKSDDDALDGTTLQSYVRQRANSRWFSIFKVPLHTYALAGQDTTRWLNRTLRNMGEAPVLFDTLQARLSVDDLTRAMQNMGYMHARTTLITRRHGKRVTALYKLHPGEPYRISSVKYDIADSTIARILQQHDAALPKEANGPLQAGSRFSVDRLEQERRRITRVLLDSGYFRFHKDFIQYSADSARNSQDIRITLRLLPWRTADDTTLTNHPRYVMRNVVYRSAEGDTLPLRQSVLDHATALRSGQYFSTTNLQKTYNNFARLQAVRYTGITFTPQDPQGALDCQIELTTNKPHTIAFQPEGTNTAGDLGAAASLTYTNRNLFRGSEMLSVELRGAFEAITGLEGYNGENYVEYSAEAKLLFPRFLAPFLSKSFKRQSTASSELSVSWDMQNRPEFHRRVFSTAWRYNWAEPTHHTTYRFDLFQLNYVYMPWISDTFKHDYLDSVSNRNAILRYNYEDLFIMRMGFGLTYNDGTHALKANIETAGNVLQGLAKAAQFKRNEQGKYTLFNIAFAQYVKMDLDYTHLFYIDDRNTLAIHAALGVAWPYGNSEVLPFEKRYFAGGANSLRGWGVRELGPGRYRGSKGRIDFINQTGDMKLDLSAEYRTHLFWKLHGAAFVDAGNIWTLRNYADQPGGQFRFNRFYKDLAVAYGLGVRLNFDYFILRLDMGMKAINPAYLTQEEHYAIFHPQFSRDLSFHFAVGLPF